MNRLLASACLVGSFMVAGARGAEPPKEWVDKDTGHRIIRLTDQPGTGSLYFNQNAYSRDGKSLIITTADRSIAVVDLKTLKTRLVVPGPVAVIITGRKTGDAYFRRRDGMICAANLDTGALREIVRLPRNIQVATVNADETLLGATQTGPDQSLSDPATQPTGGWTFAERKEISLHQRLAMHIPMKLLAIETATGKIHELLHSTDWLNHLQFSPTDPHLLLFCHEGPWHEVDRVWLIHTNRTGLTLVHHRTMNMEIAGHEFWSADGKTVWYDLQTPRGQDFWVAGYNVETGSRTWYHLQRNEWSVHYNVSPDGKLFAGDGGDSEMVAHAPDGKWIYLFHPETITNIAGIKPPNSDALIHPGYFSAEKLVNMSKHQYHLEPNVNFSPDMKYLIFRSNMFGPEYVFAVEIAKSQPLN